MWRTSHLTEGGEGPEGGEVIAQAARLSSVRLRLRVRVRGEG